MVNKTGNNDPTTEQQNHYHPASKINHVTQGLKDADTLKEKLKKIFDSSYQYYIKRELKYCAISTNANKKIELNISKKVTVVVRKSKWFTHFPCCFVKCKTS